MYDFQEIQQHDPELAKAILDSAPTNVRGKQFVRHVVDRYKRDLLGNRWVLTHQGVAFDVTGDFFDGYNRLTAISESGVAARLQVTFGGPAEGKLEVDGGAKRGLGAAIGCHPRAASIARLIEDLPGGNKTSRTRHELGAVYEKYKEGIDFSVSACGKTLLSMRRGTAASLDRPAAMGPVASDTNRTRIREAG